VHPENDRTVKVGLVHAKLQTRPAADGPETGWLAIVDRLPDVTDLLTILRTDNIFTTDLESNRNQSLSFGL